MEIILPSYFIRINKSTLANEHCILRFDTMLSGGMNVIYQIEQVPLMVAIFIHGGVLYIGYLITYLVNGWLEWGAAPILVFSGIFILCYLIIWAIIYCCSKHNTDKVNEALQYKQNNMVE